MSKAIVHISVSTVESKRGVNCEDPGSTCTAPPRAAHDGEGAAVAVRKLSLHHGVVAQVAVESEV